MKKMLFMVLGLMAAFGAQAIGTPQYPGTDYIFPDGLPQYGPGTKVEHNNRQFECKPYPESGFCTQWSESATQYEPGVGKHWKQAWDDITPETQYVFDYDFNFPDHLGLYDTGTIVEHNGEAYRCRPWPNNGFCRQWSEGNTQYEPGVGDHWQSAWEHLGTAGSQQK